MVAKAGLIGLLAGMVITALLVIVFTSGWSVFTIGVWVAVILLLASGYLAGRWSGSHHPARIAALGSLAGGLAGSLVFCFLGAAVAGVFAITLQTSREPVIAFTVRLTCEAFLICFVLGCGMGLIGGWLACPRWTSQPDSFEPSGPQMALNAAITTVLSSAMAVIFVVAVFKMAGESIREQPLSISLLLALISQMALTLVVPHEVRLSKNRCGLDEVKMAAYVGIGAAPALALALLIEDRMVFVKPVVLLAVLISAGMSAVTMRTLFKCILPKRATLFAPEDQRQKIQAVLFGTIADSKASNLIILCLGCGLVMVLPFQIGLFSVLINVWSLVVPPNLLQTSAIETFWHLFLIQLMVSGGLMATASLGLSALYLFYMKLGAWSKRRNSPG